MIPWSKLTGYLWPWGAMLLLTAGGVVGGFYAGQHWTFPGPPEPTEPITMPDVLTTQDGAVEITAKSSSKVSFHVPKGLNGKRTGNASVLVWPSPHKTGTWTVQGFIASGPDVAGAETIVTFGTPTPPVPPVPPVPPPSPAPIPVAGLRVLIVYDSSKTASLPTPQQTILFGQDFRTFLNAKTVVGADGKTHEWRIWDLSTNVADETQLWQTAFARSHPQLPWLLVSNGTTGFEGPLPATVADAEALVNKFAN